jgi:VWFA-related protein
MRRSRFLSRLAVLAAMTLAAASAAAAQSAGDPPPAGTFSESTDVLVVQVPVQVFRDGEPVRGLTAEDFQVSEGRRRLAVVGFDAHDLDAAPDGPPAEPVPAGARRHFLFLFDLAFSEPKGVVRAREAARGLLDELHPSDFAGVATYSPSQGARLVLGFTPDRAQAAAALDSLGLLPELVDRSPEPLRLVFSKTTADAASGLGSPVGVGGIAAGRALPGIGDGEEGPNLVQEELLATLEAHTVISQGADLSARRQAVSSFSDSIAALARAVAAVDGRKHVIYLSEGYDGSLLTGTTDEAERERVRVAGEEGRVWDVKSEDRFGSTRSVNQVEAMLEQLRRADCSVHSVDVGGLRDASDSVPRSSGGKGSLLQMAKDTGGDFYENFNDLSAAMDRLLRRTAVTYVLAVQPEGVEPDGSWHRLKVEVAGRSRGLRVVHRPGYYAPRRFWELSPDERMFRTASALLAGAEVGVIPLSALAVPLPGPPDGGPARVPVLVEVSGEGLLAGNRAPVFPAEVYVYAFDAAGGVVDYLSQAFGMDLGRVEARLRATGLKVYGELSLPPGEYSLRVLVRNGNTGAFSLRTMPLAVPPSLAAAPALLPPLVAEPADRWLLARTTARAAGSPPPFPFTRGGQTYIPAARPELAAGATPVLVPARGLAPGPLSVEARVLDAAGRPLGAARFALLGREEGGEAAPDLLAGEVTPPPLPPGEYRLEVTVTDSAGATVASSAPVVLGGPSGRPPEPPPIRYP